MRVAVDFGSEVAPFEQVRSQIARAITDGSVEPGFRLSPVRQLAEDLGLAPNTVARAYRELELAGLIETRGRAGSFVAGEVSGDRAVAVAAARQYVASTARLGMSATESLAIVRREIEQSSALAK